MSKEKKNNNFNAFSTFAIGAVFLLIIIAFSEERINNDVTGNVVVANNGDVSFVGWQKFYGSVGCDVESLEFVVNGKYSYFADIDYDKTYGVDRPFFVIGENNKDVIEIYINGQKGDENIYIPYSEINMNFGECDSYWKF